MVDATLFKYLTAMSGFTLPEIAKKMNIAYDTLMHKLAHKRPFTVAQMEAWGAATGCQNPGAVFFPTFYRDQYYAPRPQE